ncbi:similar to Saccharomyces cerevisiae YHL014C YLF2 Protein of unknown function, has weak similarity to E. coli GTP-binding protein gtp1 [Maudiozyma barnettii]|uniref:Obg-like ATPase homolog n=1 Tax=Maudiozyma barnettii TaxID=61262 RepID=A0A8H2ZJU4_9SACH|nr:Ylf2p [Kazachstania barnettii]CAB4256892.1 similar to Saccharomyces cerevisiae YHL014C YLF2 Protein of unknown function, has weak similarity to E. coli GTP-binding protein gtp1 [Kazachstania barnettii]CAD1785497.1 similar to Saccharomyces cerevisiae YHL014C YLF2 Protein of unknown function, has weak similarity to E. coli GTP-binding protein gtp1 [Kazachstania barnettii]
MLLGRPTNNLRAGIVGLANIGKSTFFQAITDSKLGNPANYPFATIKPSQALLKIPNPHLEKLKDLYQSKEIQHETLTVWDIAGLTRDASRGKGLGNKFLNDIGSVDGIFHLVRGFQDDNVTHLEGGVDPIRDMEIVQDELILKDMDKLESSLDHLERLGKNAKNIKDKINEQREKDLLTELQNHLYEGKKIINFKQDWTQEEVDILNKYNFLTAKPSLILLNLSAKNYITQNIPYLKQIQEWRDQFAPLDKIVSFSADFETQFNNHKSDLDTIKTNYQNSLGITKDEILNLNSSLPDIITKMKKALGLIGFYTCGPEMVKQWNVRVGSTAQEAAGVIHTDLQKTFISANVIKYDDIKDYKPPLNISQLKAKAIIKRVGKDYIMQDEDIPYFVAAGGKTK